MEIKRDKDRIDATGEIFTPEELVQEIIKNSKLDQRQNFSKTIIDPACGDGNFLVEILKVRLRAGHDPLESLSTLYGIDIMEDNIEQCKNRLIEIVGRDEKYETIVNKNIKVGDALKIEDFSSFFC